MHTLYLFSKKAEQSFKVLHRKTLRFRVVKPQWHLSAQRQEQDLFGTSLVKIPTPCFIVFYNGDRELSDRADECEMHLSDAFETQGVKGFEWTARVINIGGQHSQGLQKNCKPLYDYCIYVNKSEFNRVLLESNLFTKLTLRKQ